MLRSGESALPLPPQQRAQLAPDPAIELFQHSTFFRESEVCYPTTNYRVELVDNLFQALPTRAAQRLTDLFRETLATRVRDFQLRFLVPCDTVAQKLPLPWSGHCALFRIDFEFQPLLEKRRRQQVAADSVRLCLCWPHLRALLFYRLASRSGVLLPCFMFGPSSLSRLICPRLTSGSPSQHLSMSVALKQTARSPRVLRTHLPAYARRIYVAVFRASIGLCILLACSPHCAASIRFLFVGPAFCLRLPPDSTSRWTPLPFG